MSAGLVLSGPEVKSLKSGQASLAASYVSLRNEQAYLVHCHISPYKYAGGDKKGTGNPTTNPERERKLLLNRREINQLIGKAKGLVIIPLDIFEARGLVILRIGIGHPKKKYDKRASIKEREVKKRIRGKGEDE